jgi:hypothetical protein
MDAEAHAFSTWQPQECIVGLGLAHGGGERPSHFRSVYLTVCAFMELVLLCGRAASQLKHREAE